MPSKAFRDYRHNLVDVDRLLEHHADLNDAGGGHRGLGHLTRGGVLLLSAAWELYAESVLVEAVKVVCERLVLPTELPLSVQKELSIRVREAKHELEPLQLAGGGWKQVYIAYAIQSTEFLHTPNAANLDDLFDRYLGVESLSEQWFLEKERLDKFLEDRGRIAHRGRDAEHVRVDDLKEYREDVFQLGIDTDNFVTEHVRDITRERMPWNRMLS